MNISGLTRGRGDGTSVVGGGGGEPVHEKMQLRSKYSSIAKLSEGNHLRDDEKGNITVEYRL